MEHLTPQIQALGNKYHAKKILLFGSRARGDNRPRSDIDLAIWGIAEPLRASFWNDIEELPTLLKFDIVHIEGDTDPLLLENIQKEGVLLYENKDK